MLYILKCKALFDVTDELQHKRVLQINESLQYYG